jgi:hypothetical protein
MRGSAGPRASRSEDLRRAGSSLQKRRERDELELDWLGVDPDDPNVSVTRGEAAIRLVVRRGYPWGDLCEVIAKGETRDIVDEDDARQTAARDHRQPVLVQEWECWGTLLLPPAVEWAHELHAAGREPTEATALARLRRVLGVQHPSRAERRAWWNLARCSLEDVKAGLDPYAGEYEEFRPAVAAKPSRKTPRRP